MHLSRINNQLRRLVLPATLLAFACVGSSASAADYVALGDSSASGDGLTSAIVAGSPTNCWRHVDSYPFITGAALGLTTTSAACSGAKIADLSASQALTPDGTNAPQLDSLAASNKIVSVTIGGNDASFSTFFNQCLNSSTASDKPCTNAYTTSSIDALATGFGPALGSALDAIHARAPQARVFVVGYLPVSPASGQCFDSGRLRVTASDAPLVTYWQTRVRDTQRAAAIGHGATFIDVYAAGAGHDPCAPDGERWVFADGEGDAPLHPNPAGVQAVASMLRAAIGDPRPYLEVPPTTKPPHSPGPSILITSIKSKIRPVKKPAKLFVNSPPRARGGRLKVTLFGPQRVTFQLQRPGKPVWRWKNYGRSMRFSLPGGESSIWITGRVGKKLLPAGRYRVRAKIGDGSFWDTEAFRISR